jgi:hypothetical protein
MYASITLVITDAVEVFWNVVSRPLPARLSASENLRLGYPDVLIR